MNLARAMLLGCVGLTVALASLVLIHDEVRWGQAVVAVLLAGGTTWLVRGVFAELPAFVTGWLDAGVLTVSVLAVVVTTPLLQGLPYTVFRLSPTLSLAVAAALLGTATGGLAYTHSRLEREVQQASRQLALANQRALESRLAALSAQINPHFLFNTLNVLAEVVHEDEDLADDLLSDLAVMMRYTLEQSTQRVTLSAEVDLLRRLLRLSAARLGDRLRFQITVDPAVENALLPGLLVQPLVENALQHGVAQRPEGGEVAVTAVPDGDRVVLTVHDSGPGIPASVRAALDDLSTTGADHAGGLRNVSERLRLTWPDARMRVDDDGVTLVFPLETS